MPYDEKRNAFSVATKQIRTPVPGFQSKPWAGISERLQRIKCKTPAPPANFSSHWFVPS